LCHASEEKLGTVLAGNNWVQNITMIAFLLLTVMFAYMGFSAKSLFYIMMAVAVIGGVYTVYTLPHSLTRLVAMAMFKRKYRIDVSGFDNLPKTGPALLLGNHISWIDWAMVQIACPRPVRFVMLRSIYDRWYLKPIFKLFGVVPISSGNSRSSLAKINELLKNGEVVCLFPEGAISRTGHLGKFYSGYERTVEGVDGVIVPFYLRGLWGSKLSRSASEKLRRNTASGIKRDIVVAFGEPLPMDIKSRDLKQKVFELSFDGWEHYVESLDPIPLSWIKRAKSALTENAVTDNKGEPLTNARLLAATAAFAGQIEKRVPEQNVGLLLPASSASIIANMAVLLKGKTAVNINYTTSVEAVRAGLDNAVAHTVLTSERFVKKLDQKGIPVAEMLQGRNVIYMEDVKKDISTPSLLIRLLSAWVLPSNLFYSVYGRTVSLDDPAAILFSSGSEGTPKGIVLSHKNILANVKQISDVLDTRDDDVIMGSLPPFHSFGLTVTSFLPALEGIPLVCHPDPTDTVNIAKAVARYSVTILCGTATFLQLYTRNRKVQPLMFESLRVVIAGAEKLSPAVREAFQTKFNKSIYEGYGATETTPVASVNIPDKLDTSAWKVQQGSKVGTVGLPVPGCSFRVVDPATLDQLPVGEDGLILISGTQVMLGYLNNPDKTGEVIVELDGRRWYKTGDKGHLDEDGFLTIVDRYSRFAKLGGEMVSLGAVENAVRGVMEDEEVDFVAVNLPDPKKGEKIILLVTGAIQAEDLRKQLLANEVNPLMIPSDVKCVDEVPKLGSGKVDFSASRKLAESLLGSSSE
jgi:acyl-[acyl-carrier-protein]-phospholipid O-acyltransferase/long-chain-fatty-acid--[acyl-carrier-protein] ligase